MWVLVEINSKSGQLTKVANVTGPYNSKEEAMASILGDSPAFQRVIEDEVIDGHFSINTNIFAAIEMSHISEDVVHNRDNLLWECPKCDRNNTHYADIYAVSLEEHIRISHTEIDDEIHF